MFQMGNDLMDINEIEHTEANEEFDDVKMNSNAFGQFMKTFQHKPVNPVSEE